MESIFKSYETGPAKRFRLLEAQDVRCCGAPRKRRSVVNNNENTMEGVERIVEGYHRNRAEPLESIAKTVAPPPTRRSIESRAAKITTGEAMEHQS
jgi:hypothetical protein